MKRCLLLPALLLFSLPLFANGDDFTGWSRTGTKHFVFVYEKRDQAAVDALLSFAEDVYSQVTDFFGSYPKKIWVVVDGRIDTANGAFVPTVLPSHLVLYVTSPSVPVLGTKQRSYLRLLLTHELTHFVHLNYDRGFFALFSHLFGLEMKPLDQLFLPDWMIEGVAVNNETIFTHGGRGRDPFFEMEYRALILDDHFFSLKQAAYGSDFPPRDRVYVGGYLLVHYLLDRFGEETFTKIHERYVKFPFLGPWAAIRKVTGESANRIYLEMVQDLRARYAKYRKIPAGKLVSPKRVGSYYLPIITKEGWYEYRSNLDAPPAIIRVDPATGRERVLLETTLTDYTSLTASASGKKLVFATLDVTIGRAGTEATSDLFSLDPDSGATRRLTHSAHLWQPALSPNGQLLVAVRRDGDYSHLVTVEEQTGKVTTLFARRETNIFNPIFSPDGKQLAFALNDHGNQRIMILDLASATASGTQGGAATSQAGDLNVDRAWPLPDAPPANAYFPSFVGDDHVAFSADLGNGLALYEAPVSKSDAGGLVQVAEDPVGISRGLITGGRVFYTSYSKNGTIVEEREIERTSIQAASGRTTESPAASASKPGTRPASGNITTRGAIKAESSRYIDWPQPLLWMPLPFYTYASLGSSDFPFGIGALMYGSSLLGRNSYYAELSLRTDVLQPAFYLALDTTIGKNHLSYILDEGYAPIGTRGYAESVDQSLALTIPLLAEHLMSTTTTLALAPGVSDHVAVEAAQPFSFARPFQSPKDFDTIHSYSLDLNLALSRYRSAASCDIYSPHDLELGLQTRFYPPFLSDATSWVDSVVQGSIAVPSFMPGQVVQFGVKNSYSSSSGERTPVIFPRGLFISNSSSPSQVYRQTTSGRSIIAVDYLVNLSLLDRPLPLGFNLQGLAAGVHLEAAADWDVQKGVFIPDRSLYAGAELVSLIGYQSGAGPIPVGFGLSIRFDPTFSRPFAPLFDIAPYIFFSTNSFLSPREPVPRRFTSSGVPAP